LLDDFASRWIGATVHLIGLPFHVDKVATNATCRPQAAQLPYEALIEGVEGSLPPESVKLRFLAHITFRRSPLLDGSFGDRSYDLPFPLPALVFGGLLWLWNAFGPQLLPEELRSFARDCVVVNRYRLRTKRVDFWSVRRGRVEGFVGVCRFPIRFAEVAWRRRIGLRVAFEPFAGVGWRTEIGLGQT